jgi:eukaryotic-like serine/threonine-protein kinase
MNREKDIFEQALDLASTQERVAFLKGACGAEAAMLERLLSLLRASEGAEAFLPETPQGVGTAKLDLRGNRDEAIGSRIGHYKLLQKIGEGGCGVVYMAEQEQPVRRRVALKIIKLGMDTRSVVARFEAERQALAMMDHPNIAKVFEAGTVGEAESQISDLRSQIRPGRPYFVMELVRGIRITDYCDENQLTTVARLNLFINVCHAVQHAHQKGIIHRDLKPSNILVTLHDRTPVPKVIDFGIAKATEQKLTDKTLFTELHQFIGTPAYISPEQAEMSGLDIDTRSDVYSLGVLLYELLAGSTPFDTKELLASGLDSMRRTIREKAPPRPSTRVATLGIDQLTTTAKRRASEAPKLIHLLKGDLDWIVMKCLEKDRTRRYDTANSLAADLKRHLNSEPVEARPPSRLYEFQKLVRRHKWGFVAAAAFMAVLLTGTGVSTWQAIRAIQAKNAEVKQRISAEKAEARAATLQKKAEDQSIRAEWLVYASRLTLAQADFETGNGGLALQHLSECQDKLRGWEWHYLWSRINAKLTLKAHVGGVMDVAFSPDGRRLVTCGLDQTAKVWDATTGKQLITLEGHKGHLYCTAFSPDGRRIVTGAGFAGTGISPGEAKVWDTATGQQLFELKGHNYSVFAVAFSPDRRRIATAAAERAYGPSEVKVWDAATGQELLTIPLSENVRCVAFSPDGQRIVTGSAKMKVKIWDAATGKDLLTVTAHSGRITGVAFSPDGRRIVSSSWDKTAMIWDAATGRELHTLKGHAGVVFSAAFSPDGRRIVTGSSDQTAKIWDAETALEIFTLKGHAAMLRSVAFSPDGHRIATASEDNSARVWDAERGQEIPMLGGHARDVNSIAFRPDGERLVTSSGDNIARVWDTATGRVVLSLGGKGGSPAIPGVWSVAFSPDGQRIVTGGQDKLAKVWDAETGQELLALDHANAVLSAVFSPDGKLIAAGVGWYGEQRVGEVKVWDTATGQLRFTLQATPAWAVAFSPDGKRLATGGANGAVKLWNAATGQEILALKRHRGGVSGVAFSRDGRRLVTGSHDKTAKVWDTGTGQELFTLKGHTHYVRCVAFSPDGQRIVTGSDDRTVRIWESSTGEEVFTLKGHTKEVRSVAFSPDGQRLVTGADAVARVWSAAPLEP